ncbi:unnamed protein product [Discosporangium mesarthrocarpum]
MTVPASSSASSCGRSGAPSKRKRGSPSGLNDSPTLKLSRQPSWGVPYPLPAATTANEKNGGGRGADGRLRRKTPVARRVERGEQASKTAAAATEPPFALDATPPTRKRMRTDTGAIFEEALGAGGKGGHVSAGDDLDVSAGSGAVGVCQIPPPSGQSTRSGILVQETPQKDWGKARKRRQNPGGDLGGEGLDFGGGAVDGHFGGTAGFTSSRPLPTVLDMPRGWGKDEGASAERMVHPDRRLHGADTSSTAQATEAEGGRETDGTSAEDTPSRTSVMSGACSGGGRGGARDTRYIPPQEAGNRAGTGNRPSRPGQPGSPVAGSPSSKQRLSRTLDVTGGRLFVAESPRAGSDRRGIGAGSRWQSAAGEIELGPLFPSGAGGGGATAGSPPNGKGVWSAAPPASVPDTPMKA